MATGYREATLQGVDGDATVIGQPLPIDLGADTADQTVIYADILYLQSGATYSWPGKAVTIVARQLGMTSANGEYAVLTVSGADGLPPETQTPVAPGPPPQADQGPAGGKGAEGVAGQAGVAGADGNPGQDAGSITIVTAWVLGMLLLDVSAAGGNGSNAFDGQDGQDGGQGGDEGPEEVPVGMTSPPSKPPARSLGGQDWNPWNGQGGAGGDAGPGGAGGNGGNGGAVTIAANLFVDPAKVNVAGGQAGTNGADGTPGVGGPPGYDGDGGGAQGNQASSQPPPQAGQNGPVGYPAAPLTYPAPWGFLQQAFSADQVGLVLARMQFTYLVCQTLVNPAASDTDAQAQLEALGADVEFWDLFIPVAGGPGATPAWTSVRAVLDDLRLKIQQGLDFYGHKVNAVPTLACDVSALGAELAALQSTETWHQTLQDAVADYDQRGADVQAQFTLLADKFNADVAQEGTDNATLSKLRDEITTAEAAVQAAAKTLNQQFTEELAAAAGSWDPDSLLASLGSTLAMYNPESAGLAFMAGGALSGVSSLNTGTINLGAGNVSSDLLIAQTKQVEATLAGLQAGWTGVTGQGLLQPNGNLTLLLAERQSLDTFVTQTFPDDGGLLDAVDAFMDAVQAQNALVVSYNNAVVDYLGALADSVHEQEATATLGSNLEALDAPGLLQLSRLATYAYTHQMQAVLLALYQAGRAYECLTLTPSDALSVLAGLGTLAGVDSDALGVCLDTLNAELVAFQQDQPSMPTTTKLVFTAQATDPTTARHVQSVQTGWQTTFVLQPTTATNFMPTNELAGLFDIRVKAVRGYVVGAGTDGDRINVDVDSGGVADVQAYAPDQTLLEFDVPEMAYSNIFSYDNGKRTDLSSALVDEMAMRWGTSDVDAMTAPLMPLFALWRLQVDDRTLDVSKVSEVSLEFDVVYRAQATPATTALNAPGSAAAAPVNGAASATAPAQPKTS
ncbi:collagen-like triple helix repeat-containing protein [Aquihabitans sp. McL0605]|uniref:collagen-like triple helix repeat-containing protein n=1 Tax=Aquihabitans sp. McL0605 TaxID=3415671 RepID=UPI003CF87577